MIGWALASHELFGCSLVIVLLCFSFWLNHVVKLLLHCLVFAFVVCQFMVEPCCQTASRAALVCFCLVPASGWAVWLNCVVKLHLVLLRVCAWFVPVFVRAG